MGKGNLAQYVNRFFDELEIYEDTARGHCYKAYIREAVRSFLENETADTAYEVYRTIFDSYKITMSGDTNPFLDILDTLRTYENTAATLIGKQRDHFVHAVNVFITGISIYAENDRFRTAFCKAVPEKEYRCAYTTRNEEFFYRWALASLFHDIGYPVEIAGKQLNEFVDRVANFDGNETKVRVKLSFENFEELNSIQEVIPEEVFAGAFREAYPQLSAADLLRPLDLMACRIHCTLGTDFGETAETLNGFVRKMAEGGFIDHGYYSAITILKWYGYLIQKNGFRSEYFFWPVLDSATAILLHNLYGNVLQKSPYCLGPMKAEDNPVAYLLILCDELQEWNRTARGYITRTFTLADKAYLGLETGYLSVTYMTHDGLLPQGFCDEKTEKLNAMLDIPGIFPKGFFVDNESDSEIRSVIFDRGSAPRPLMENIEMLAIAIHERYCRKQLEDYPDRPLAYPRFSDLPDSMKYSNIRQALGIYEKLTLAGLCMRRKGEPGSLSEIPENTVEMLAEMEHDSWMKERIASGWTLGEKDPANKKTPYLIPYEELTEEIKDYDRDAVRNIPELAYMIGMAIYEL